MTDLADGVRERLHQLAAYAPADSPIGPTAPVMEAATRPPSSGARARSLLAAACVVALVATTAVVLRDGDGARVVATSGTTELLTPAGIEGRSRAVHVWTGRELIVWGGATYDGGVGGRSLASGAILDPSANRWRTMAPAPIAPRSGAVAAWTGQEMLVWGGGSAEGPFADGAAFDPRANRWRSISPRPRGGEVVMAAVWTGSEMLVVGGSGTSAYDPAADRWRDLAPAPGAPVIPYPQLVWTGSDLIGAFWPGIIGSPPAPGTASATATTVGTAAGGDSGPPASPPRPSGTPPPPLEPPPVAPGRPNADLFLASYSPAADQWTRLPDFAMEDGGIPRLTWTGSEVLVLMGGGGGGAFDPARRTWRPLPPVPGGRLPDADAVWTGRLALFWGGGDSGFAFDPAAGTWRTFDAGGLRPRGDPVVAWARDVLVAWGGMDVGPESRTEADGVLYRPQQ